MIATAVHTALFVPAVPSKFTAVGVGLELAVDELIEGRDPPEPDCIGFTPVGSIGDVVAPVLRGLNVEVERIGTLELTVALALLKLLQ